MGGVHKRPKKHLRFSNLLKCLQEAINEIDDCRTAEKTIYTLSDFYTCGFAIFFLQDKSVLEFQRRLQKEINRNNLCTVFNIKNLPSDTQLRDVIDNHSYKPIQKVFKQYFSILQRGKYLSQFQFLDSTYLITIDGTEYFSSESIHCKKCLYSKTKEGGLRYHHQILQATLVHPEMRQVIPFAPEFIRNRDGQEKQDCERNAGKRLINRIKKDHPFLHVVIGGDSLYSNQPFINELRKNNFSYILTAKPNDHKSLYADIQGLRRSGLLDNVEKKENKRKYVYEWVNDVPLNDNPESPLVNFVQLQIYKGEKMTFKSAWITDVKITNENVFEIVAGGRARWKIENEGFNTLKNHGYHHEHNFGHGKKNLSEALFILNLLAFYFHQIFSLSNYHYQTARADFSARIEYWNFIRSIFRIFLFDSWEQLLERMNSPPTSFIEK